MEIGGGGIGKASEEMLKELQKTQKQDQAHEGGAGKASESHAKFEQTLQNHTQVNEAQNLQKLQEATKTQSTSTLQAAKSTQINQTLATQKVTPTEAPKSSVFNGVVKELMGGQNKMEGLMKVAMSGQKLSNQEMLGIQAGVYMYSQQMELTSKVIDKATSGIKQAMNTQV